MHWRHRPKVLIADGHLLVAEACKHLLKPEFEVIAVVSSGRALLEAAETLQPDLVILEIALPELNGLDAGEKIKFKDPSIKLVYLTMFQGPDVAAEAFRRGASGYVLKQCSAGELVLALRCVLNGDSYLSPLLTKDTVNFLLCSAGVDQEERQISGRQREVLQLLAEGKSMKEIAGILDVKPGTVAFHKYRIMHELHIKTNAALVEYAIKQHIIAAN